MQHQSNSCVIIFSLAFLDRKIYSTSGGEVLFTKMDQEAEMDIKVLCLSIDFSSSSWKNLYHTSMKLKFAASAMLLYISILFKTNVTTPASFHYTYSCLVKSF